MTWWLSIMFGAASVFAFEFFKAILRKCNMRPIVQIACAFVLTMLFMVAIACAVNHLVHTPH